MSIAKKRIHINNMLTKKIWLLIGALAVLCAGVVGVNAYFLKKTAPVTETPEEITEESTSTVPEEVSLSSEIDTSDWMTYKNEEYGFEIKYPSEGEFIEEKFLTREGEFKEPYLDKIEIYIPCFEKVQNIAQEHLKYIPDSRIQGEVVCVGEEVLEISVSENYSQLPIKEWFWESSYPTDKEYIKEYIRDLQITGHDFQFEDITLNGEKGMRIQFLPAQAPDAGGCEMFFFQNYSKIYSIGFCLYEAFYAPCSGRKEIKEKILSSFKFLSM